MPDGNGQILCGRNAVEEFGDFLIQEALVNRIQYFTVQDFFQLLQVDHKTRTWIDFAFHRDFQGVIVPVAVGIIAFPENTLVLLGSELRAVIVVRSSKFSFTREINHLYLRARGPISLDASTPA